MASRLFKPSRLIAVALVIGAGLWIVSGRWGPEAEEATPATTAPATAKEPAAPVQKVAVAAATPEQHERQVVLSCVTQADQRSIAVARGAGVIVDLKVEPRQRSCTPATSSRRSPTRDARRRWRRRKALLDQRQAEYDANKQLIDRGDAPRNNLPGARSGGRRGARRRWPRRRPRPTRPMVRSPIDGIVDTVPVQVGQAVQPGAEIAEIVGPDPMLAVGAVSERQRGLLKVGQNADDALHRRRDGRPARSVSSASAPTRRRAPTASRRGWPTPTPRSPTA